MKRRRLALLFAPLLFSACESARSIRNTVIGATPHERYADGLRDAGLHGTALGAAWLSAAEAAVGRAASVTTPFRETGFFAAGEPSASAYRFPILRGQRIHASVELGGDQPVRVFLDLFEVPGDTAQAPRHIAAAETGILELDAESRRDAEFILRIQPELLTDVRYTVEIRAVPSLAFPVGGLDSRAIGSRFGALRDAGRRAHHGVDIFAPRGTPVLAASDGVVRRVGANRLGGNVVWISDSRRGISQYYAHLDTQLVQSGQRVAVGDTIGLVGNTGNARSTPPHLHFGIYASREGPVDPYPFLHEPAMVAPRVSADTARLGAWSRSLPRGMLVVRDGPAEGAAEAARLPRHTPLRVLGASAGWYRVALPDGGSGYVAANLTEPAGDPISSQRFARSAAVLTRPLDGAVVMDSIPPGATRSVLGRFGSFVMVESGEGRLGWVGL